MIKHICQCEICGAEDSFNPDNTIMPISWKRVYCLFDENEFAHVCPSCWLKIKTYADELRKEARP